MSSPSGGDLPRPALLVSVRSPAEAEEAVAGGVDLLDVKEPLAGSLGAADPHVVSEVAGVAAGRVPWTMACGELATGLEVLQTHLADTWRALQAAQPVAAPLPVAIKVGLSGCQATPWQRDLEAVQAELPQSVGQVLVIYADAEECQAPAAAAVLAAAADLPAVGVLVDTYHKQGAGLLGQRSLEELQSWQEQAAAAGCAFAVAGKLRVEEFQALRSVNADIIAVRSAVCSTNRTGPVEQTLVRLARQALVRSPNYRFSLAKKITEKRS